MDLQELNAFLVVAREKSFSRAADKLYRTQPAVSLAVRRLEDWIGQRLFVRGGRTVRLTDAGEVLRDYAERILNLREETRRAVEELGGLHRGRVSLGVNESSIHALLPLLARFHRRHPNIHVAVQRTFSRDIPHEVLNYRLDLGVVSYIPTEEKLAAVPIFRDYLTFVVPPGHRLARRRIVDISELGEESFIAHIVDSPYRWRVIQLFERHRVPLRMTVELPTIESIKRFVQMGMGVAIVPRMCVRWDVERNLLVEVKIRQLNLPRHLHLIHRRDARFSRAAAALVRLLEGRIGKG
ncbi:MAG TPA: LysR substrate-binding domain-containing protein [Candidatus Xenobia bacterium]|nr:LysR substrate-binding domain-containing protein [Candidatus Xenobia bacterium]